MDNCVNVFSKSKAFHGIIFQKKTFTINFCKPSKLFVNLGTFFFFLYRKCIMALITMVEINLSEIKLKLKLKSKVLPDVLISVDWLGNFLEKSKGLG